MYLNVKHKIAFIHIPRTGGLGFTHSLTQKYGGRDRASVGRHCTLLQLRDKVPEVDRCFKFCMVRNPYSRIKSVWQWCNQHKKTAARQKWTRIEDMLEFIEQHPKGKIHWFPQTFFTHIDGAPQHFDKIYRNENYDEMLNDFEVKVAKRSNGTVGKLKLNDFSKRWIEKLYRDDFELLKY